MNPLKLILVSPQRDLCQAWEKHFKDLPDIEISHGFFEKLEEFDCMVSAANSFGLMDGGVDLAIVNFFGRQLEKRVQQYILDNYLGEQPIGTSFIVETGDAKHPFLAHSPTMRSPMTIEHTDYPYLAMWATLLAIRQHNLSGKSEIKSVACPGLGSGTGMVPADEAARQMAAAYQNFLFPPTHIDWRLADERQSQIGRGGDMGYIFSSMRKKLNKNKSS